MGVHKRTHVQWIPSNTAWQRWYRASLRHDLREAGMLDAEETEDERDARLNGPPPNTPGIN